MVRLAGRGWLRRLRGVSGGGRTGGGGGGGPVVSIQQFKVGE